MMQKWSCVSNYLRLVVWLIESRSNQAEEPESLMVLRSRVGSDCLWICSNFISFMEGWDVSLADSLVSFLCSPHQAERTSGESICICWRTCRGWAASGPAHTWPLGLRTRPACCQHLHPNNNTCCSGQFQHYSHWCGQKLAPVSFVFIIFRCWSVLLTPSTPC